MMEHIPSLVWNILGVLQVLAGVLIWLPKYRKYVAGFFAVYYVGLHHHSSDPRTSDFGGSAFVGALLGVLVWNPSFLTGKKK